MSFTGRRSSSALVASLAGIGLVLALWGCKKAADEPAEVAVSVQVAHPTVGAITEEIAADAILAPLSQAAIAPKITAPIKREYVQRGARVRAGQLLLTLEDQDLTGSAMDSRGNLEQAQEALNTVTGATIPDDMQKARLDVDQASANLEVAKRTAEERKRLFAEGAIAGRDTDTAVAAAVQAQAAYDVALQHLASVRNTIERSAKKSAEAQLTSAQGRLASAEAQVSYANLRSPIDGVVTERPFFAGETAPAGTAVVTVMDTSSLLAKLHLAQASAQLLQLGGSAEVTVPGVTEPVEAQVSFISPALDPRSTTVEVWLKLRNKDGRFKVGTPVHVSIGGRTVQQALQVPATAVLPGQESALTVMVVGADSTAQKRTVTLGIRTPETVQVKSGLSASDTVITSGSYGLDEGTKVAVTSGKAGGEDKD